MKKIFLFSLFIAFIHIAAAQNEYNVYPTHWWVGMKNPKLQLMVHGENIASTIPTFKLPAAGVKIADGVTLKATHRAENPNYMFIDLVIDKNAKPGMRILKFGTGAQQKQISFELKARRKGNGTTYAQGVRSQDFMYLIMPDRFANGNPDNDHIAGMKDQSLNRDSMYHRHGGDLQGVTSHLDYLKDL